MNQNDTHLVVDLVVAGLSLSIIKTFVEPGLVALTQRLYRSLDDRFGGVLPNLFRGTDHD